MNAYLKSALANNYIKKIRNKVQQATLQFSPHHFISYQ